MQVVNDKVLIYNDITLELLWKTFDEAREILETGDIKNCYIKGSINSLIFTEDAVVFDRNRDACLVQPSIRKTYGYKSLNIGGKEYIMFMLIELDMIFIQLSDKQYNISIRNSVIAINGKRICYNKGSLRLIGLGINSTGDFIVSWLCDGVVLELCITHQDEVYFNNIKYYANIGLNEEYKKVRRKLFITQCARR